MDTDVPCIWICDAKHAIHYKGWWWHHPASRTCIFMTLLIDSYFCSLLIVTAWAPAYHTSRIHVSWWIREWNACSMRLGDVPAGGRGDKGRRIEEYKSNTFYQIRMQLYIYKLIRSLLMANIIYIPLPALASVGFSVDRSWVRYRIENYGPRSPRYLTYHTCFQHIRGLQKNVDGLDRSYSFHMFYLVSGGSPDSHRWCKLCNEVISMISPTNYKYRH